MSGRLRSQRTKAPWTVVLLVAGGVFVITAIFAHQPGLAAWEEQLLRAIYGWPAGWRLVALAFTQTGSLGFGVVVMTVLLTARGPYRLLGQRYFFLLAGVYLAVYAAKLWLGRPRPAQLIPGLMSRELFVSGAGFPSGHSAAVAVTALTVTVLLPPRLRLPLAAAWILLVGWSRVYLGVHAPLDIFGGWALGIMVYSAARLLWPPVTKFTANGKLVGYS